MSFHYRYTITYHGNGETEPTQYLSKKSAIDAAKAQTRATDEIMTIWRHKLGTLWTEDVCIARVKGGKASHFHIY